MLAICKPLCRRLYLHFLFSFHLWSSYRPLYKSSHCRQSHLPTKKGVLLRHDSRQVVHKAPPAQHRWHPSPTGTSLEPAPCDPHGGSLLPVAPPLRAAVLAPSYFFRLILMQTRTLYLLPVVLHQRTLFFYSNVRRPFHELYGLHDPLVSYTIQSSPL